LGPFQRQAGGQRRLAWCIERRDWRRLLRPECHGRQRKPNKVR